eukprot:jgi/Mesvir1/6818/Mv09006-RA.2
MTADVLRSPLACLARHHPVVPLPCAGPAWLQGNAHTPQPHGPPDYGPPTHDPYQRSPRRDNYMGDHRQGLSPRGHEYQPRPDINQSHSPGRGGPGPPPWGAGEPQGGASPPGEGRAFMAGLREIMGGPSADQSRAKEDARAAYVRELAEQVREKKAREEAKKAAVRAQEEKAEREFQERVAREAAAAQAEAARHAAAAQAPPDIPMQAPASLPRHHHRRPDRDSDNSGPPPVARHDMGPPPSNPFDDIPVGGRAARASQGAPNPVREARARSAARQHAQAAAAGCVENGIPSGAQEAIPGLPGSPPPRAPSASRGGRSRAPSARVNHSVSIEETPSRRESIDGMVAPEALTSTSSLLSPRATFLINLQAEQQRLRDAVAQQQKTVEQLQEETRAAARERDAALMQLQQQKPLEQPMGGGGMGPYKQGPGRGKGSNSERGGKTPEVPDYWSQQRYIHSAQAEVMRPPDALDDLMASTKLIPKTINFIPDHILQADTVFVPADASINFDNFSMLPPSAMMLGDPGMGMAGDMDGGRVSRVGGPSRSPRDDPRGASREAAYGRRGPRPSVQMGAPQSPSRRSRLTVDTQSNGAPPYGIASPARRRVGGDAQNFARQSPKASIKVIRKPGEKLPRTVFDKQTGQAQREALDTFLDGMAHQPRGQQQSRFGPRGSVPVQEVAIRRAFK